MLFEEGDGQLIDGIAIGDEERFQDGIIQEVGAELLHGVIEGSGSGEGISFEADVAGNQEALGRAVDKDDIAPGAADTDIGFVAADGSRDFDGGVGCEWLESVGGGFGVVEDGLVGEGDVEYFFKSCGCFSGREAEVDKEGERQADDVGCGVGSGQVDGWSVGSGGMEFGQIEVGLSIEVGDFHLPGLLFSEVFLFGGEVANFLQAVWALCIDTFMDDVAFSDLVDLEFFGTVGAAVLNGFEFDPFEEGVVADFAEILATSAIVVIDIVRGGVTVGACDRCFHLG